MAEHSKQTVEQNYNLLNSRIKKSHQRFASTASCPKLIAVTKTLPAEKITPLLDLGHRIFGENRVQEALAKWPDLKLAYQGVELHLIGPLQTNKVRDAIKIFDVVQSLDREKLAKSLAGEIQKTGRNVQCFVQVNMAAEQQKSGIEPKEAVAFVKKCREQYGLKVAGLMCIPPQGEAAGPHFALLKILAQEAEAELLSMGMSADFETAIEMGATHIRVGTVLFGKR